MYNKLRSKAVLIAAEAKAACLIPEENQPLSSLILRQLISFRETQTMGRLRKLNFCFYF